MTRLATFVRLPALRVVGCYNQMRGAAMEGAPEIAPLYVFLQGLSVVAQWTICHFCKRLKDCEPWYNRWRCKACY